LEDERGDSFVYPNNHMKVLLLYGRCSIPVYPEGGGSMVLRHLVTTSQGVL